MSVLVFTAACSRVESKRLPVYPTPSWGRLGVLSLRMNGGELLMQHSASPVVYVYDAGAKALHEADRARWDAAPGATTDCDVAGRPDSKEWRIDSNGQLLQKDAPQKLAGARALLVRLSPTGTWLAALSAQGKAEQSLFPALGGAPVQGPLFHQVLAAADGSCVGAPLQLAAEFERSLVLSCWSPDEQHVVYYDLLLSKISIASFVSPKKEHS